MSNLLPYQQLAGSRIISCFKRVEIHTCRNLLTKHIPAIPMDRTRTVMIEIRSLMPQLQLPNNNTAHIVNRQCDFRRFRQLIRYPRLWVERVREVRQQCIFKWNELSYRYLNYICDIDCDNDGIELTIRIRRTDSQIVVHFLHFIIQGCVGFQLPCAGINAKRCRIRPAQRIGQCIAVGICSLERIADGCANGCILRNGECDPSL